LRRSVATVSLSGDLEEKLVAASTAGFDGIELFENDLVCCPLSPAEIRRRLLELGLDLLLYQPFRDFEAVPSDSFARNLRRLDRKLALSNDLGAEMLLVVSSISEQAVDDDQLAATHLHTLAEQAATYGVRVAYEALAWGRHVNTFDHSWRIVEAADHPNLGVCLDSFHILSRGSDPATIREIPGEKIFFVQLADAPRLTMDVLQWSRHHRCLPGQGAFALDEFVAHALATGYEGPLSLEVFNDILRQVSPEKSAVDAMRSLVALEDALPRSATSAARRQQLRRLPSPPKLRRYAFVELAVDLHSEPLVGRMLSALGFRRAALHRSKPVELWQHGDARILLNRDERRVLDEARGIARVSTIGLESADPAASSERANLLLAPRLPRHRGPREAELTAIAAPDGTSVFFCGGAEFGGPVWLDDFVGWDGSTATEPEPFAVDHVALAQPFECFDESVLFYRSVLGLDPQASHELVTPDGLMRSRGLASRDGVRIVLNAPLLGGGAVQPPAAQHVAFTCRDVFAAARNVAARGVPVLPITDNFYDDLAARLELADERVEEMRQLGVLYDRDQHGELLHFYTPLVGAGLFFEVIQRVSGYDGYGAGNAAARLAAQRERVRRLAMA
jgi:4-hydroxyphenylpyruvate dioxygenase